MTPSRGALIAAAESVRLAVELDELGHDWCSDERCPYGCDHCGQGFDLPTRVCPSCGYLTCEMEAMHVGDAAEARGEDREKAVRPDA